MTREGAALEYDVTQDKPRCTVGDCLKPAAARGMCKTHWGRWRRHGDANVLLVHRHEGCSVDNCSERHMAKGYCRMHYARWKRHGDPGVVKCYPARTCSVDDCERRHQAKGFCSVHYGRSLRAVELGPVPFEPELRLPAEPFLEILRARLARGEERKQIAVRLGLHDIDSIFRRKTFRESTADRYVTALGLHLDVVWPQGVAV